LERDSSSARPVLSRPIEARARIKYSTPQVIDEQEWLNRQTSDTPQANLQSGDWIYLEKKNGQWSVKPSN
jgi:hypothetical protein